MVVMYHYVRDGESLPRPGGIAPLNFASPGSPGPFAGIAGLSTAEFGSQLDRLCAAMEPIEWPRLYAWMNGRGDLPERSFLLTFDDGLSDHAEAALLALEARGLRGVFFVPGAVLTGHRMLSAHAIHLLLSALGDDVFTSEVLDGLAFQDASVDWKRQWMEQCAATEHGASTVYGYESPARARLKYFLTMELPIELRTAVVDSLFGKHIGSSARWARHWYLGWDDLVRMHSAGHTIGGHGFSHEPYGRLTPAEIRRDVIRSSLVLRRGLGADIRPFSYPYGSTSGPVYDACREAGFAQAFTTQRQWLTRRSGAMQLPRFDTIHVAAALRQEQLRSVV